MHSKFWCSSFAFIAISSAATHAWACGQATIYKYPQSEAFVVSLSAMLLVWAVSKSVDDGLGKHLEERVVLLNLLRLPIALAVVSTFPIVWYLVMQPLQTGWGTTTTIAYDLAPTYAYHVGAIVAPIAAAIAVHFARRRGHTRPAILVRAAIVAVSLTFLVAFSVRPAPVAMTNQNVIDVFF